MVDMQKTKTKWMQALDSAVAGEPLTHMMPPHINFLQLPPITHWQDEYILIDWMATESIYQGGGMVFGGYISALADYAAGTAMLTSIDDDDIFATHKLNIEYKKPVRAGNILIKAEVVSSPSKFMEVIVTFTNAAGELCAVATAFQTVLNRGRSAQLNDE